MGKLANILSECKFWNFGKYLSRKYFSIKKVIIKLHSTRAAAVQYLPNDITSGLWFAKTVHTCHLSALAHTKSHHLFCAESGRQHCSSKHNQRGAAIHFVEIPLHSLVSTTDSCLALEFWLNTKLKTKSSSSRRWFVYFKQVQRMRNVLFIVLRRVKGCSGHNYLVCK